MMHSKIGELIRVGRTDMLQTAKGEAGCVVFGPYYSLSPGQYEVDFQVNPDSFRIVSPCCVVDVLSSGHTVVKRRELSASELKASNGWVTLSFEAQTTEIFEFRVFATGQVGIKVNYDRPLRRISPLPESAKLLLSGSDSELPDLFKVHHALFQDLSTKGFSFCIADGLLIATFNAISFTMENLDDIQLLGEIFLINEYNVITSKPSIVIDIGMNVGLTSLYLAAKANVSRVYSFEPFSAPFKRASRNLSLNPVLSSKIVSTQIGLSNKDETLSVLASTGSTIGVSVNGVQHGSSEVIIVKDASEVLRPIIMAASAANQHIIMKVDCEGSEFAIFETLISTGLIDHVSAIVCEWHKWWSPEKSQHDLIQPLIDRGFIAIDRTDPSDPHAGLFYAVKNNGSTISQ